MPHPQQVVTALSFMAVYHSAFNITLMTAVTNN